MTKRKLVSVTSLLGSIGAFLWTMLFPYFAVAAPADKPWEGPVFSAPPEVMMQTASAVPVKEGIHVVVLFREAKYVFEADGRSVETWRFVYRILTPEGLTGWSTAEAHWAPWHQERPLIRARVITADGTEHWLDPKTVGESPERQSEGDVFTDRRVLQAPLPAVAPGAVVEEEIVIRETAPLFAQGVINSVMFGFPVPVHRSRLIVEAPASLLLRHVVRLLPSVVEHRSENAGRVQLTFESGALDPIEEFDPYPPSDVPQWPYVAFSTGQSWAEVAAGYGRIVDAQIAVTPVQNLTEQLIRGAKNRKAVLESLLLHLHREVRDTGVEFGEAAIVPRTPAETLQRKYGDCKDQATLLVALLRSAGIEAYVALLRSGLGLDVERDLPGLGVFDHVIVYVPGTPPLWIDPTVKFARLGQLPVGDQGRLALIARPQSSELVRVPEATSTDNRILETREFFLAEEGKARVVETTEAWGSTELFYRHNYSQASQQSIQQGLEQYAKSTYLADGVANIEHSDPLDLTPPFRIRFEAVGAQRGWTDTDGAGVAIFLAPLAERLSSVIQSISSQSTANKKRRTDLSLPEPIVTEWRYRIVPPPGFAATQLPEGGMDRLGPATLSKKFAVEEDAGVTATFVFDTQKRRLTPDEIEQLRKGVETLENSPPTLVSFAQTGEVHLAAGRIREALAEFRKLIALHPNEALHRTQVARALLAAGLGQAAREEADRAIALQPSSAVAHRTLGWILQHDLVGRRFKKGFDPDRAVAAYRKAIELNPSDVLARTDLAILLEHDAQGIRYSAKAKLEEAIAEYRALPEQLDSSSPLYNNLPVALLYARRFEELKELVRGQEQTSVRKQILLAATTASDGAEAALKEAAKLFADDESRQAALTGVATTLIQLRLYPQAGTLLTAATKGATNAVELLGRADMIRKTKRFEELPLAESDPRSVVKRAFVSLMLDPGPDKFLSFFSREARADALKETDTNTNLQKLQRRGRSLLQRQEIPVEVALDIALSNIQFVLEGDDASGYRIRMQGASPAGAVDEVYFVVLEEGQYRILGAGSELSQVGKEALQHAEKGDLDGARRWLDWAREELALPGGDDPFSGPPFPRFWTKGSNADLDAIRYAAASLMVASPDAERAIAILQEGRQKATTEDARTNFDLALMAAFYHLKRPADVLPIARNLVTVKPSSRAGFVSLARALTMLKQWDDLKGLCEERLKTLPDDPTALRLLAEIAQRRGDFKEANRIHQRLTDLGKAEPVDFNNMAWQSLFEESVTEKALEAAQRAVTLTRNENAAALHTLASLFAELGMTNEARDVILHAMEVGAMEEPEPNYWYVFGRIAEQYGEEEAAATAYRKVKAPEPPEDPFLATYDLAQKRLTLLEVKLKKASAEK